MKEHLIAQADLAKLTGIPTGLIMDRYRDYYNWKVVSHFKRKNLLNVSFCFFPGPFSGFLMSLNYPRHFCSDYAIKIVKGKEITSAGPEEDDACCRDEL